MNYREDPEHLYTVIETSNRFSVSRAQVYVMLARGELKAVKIGKLLRVKGSSIQAYIDSLPTAEVKAGAKIAA